MTGPRRTVSVMLMAMLLLAFSSVAALAQPTTLTISGLEDHYHTGDEATLTAVQDPETGEDHYHWFVRTHHASGFEVVPGVYGDSYTFVVSSDLDGAKVQAKLYDHDHRVIAESDVVTIVIDDHDDDHGHGDDDGHGHGDDDGHGHGDDHGHEDDHDHGHEDDHDHGHEEDHAHSDENAAGGATQGEAPVGGVPAGFGGTAQSGSALAGSMSWIALAVALTLALGAGAVRMVTRR